MMNDTLHFREQGSGRTSAPVHIAHRLLAPASAKPNPLDRLFPHSDGVYHVRQKAERWLLSWGDNQLAEYAHEADAIAEMRRLAAIWRKESAYKVYFIGEECRLGTLVKIGLARNVQKRLHTLRTASPSDLRVLACREGDRAVELAYHARFHRCRVRGEWFRITPALRREIESAQNAFSA